MEDNILTKVYLEKTLISGKDSVSKQRENRDEFVLDWLEHEADPDFSVFINEKAQEIYRKMFAKSEIRKNEIGKKPFTPSVDQFKILLVMVSLHLQEHKFKLR